MAYDANSDLRRFQHDEVYADPETRMTAEKRRSANRDRLERGLNEMNKPLPVEYVPQGSFAMQTMVHAPNEASDIDDGVVFTRESLLGPKGGDMSAQEAKQMVCDAIAKEDKFKTPPEVRSNCVRVHYEDGFHVDMPVYRRSEENGSTKKQRASTNGEWKDSAPEDINAWFADTVKSKSPETVGSRQMRRMVRLLKYWSKSRSNWAMPSGFVLSVLVDEAYPHGGLINRDDKALLQVMRTIRSNRQWSEQVFRPVNPREEITNERTRTRVKNFVEELKYAIDDLSVLEKDDCDQLAALRALKKVFNTDYWDKRIKELEDGGNDGGGNGRGGDGGVPKGDSGPKSPVIKQGGHGQYA
jgi:hypothetical protein